MTWHWDTIGTTLAVWVGLAVMLVRGVRSVVRGVRDLTDATRSTTEAVTKLSADIADHSRRITDLEAATRYQERSAAL